MTMQGFPQLPAAGTAAGLLLLIAAGGSAQSMDDAAVAFAEGRFLEAVEIAEALGTAEGYILAARSLAVHGHYLAPEGEREAVLERAAELGEMAMEADPASAEAHYAAAHALGRYAQAVGAMSALRRGYGGRVRDLLEATLALDSLHAGAHAALGGWHADVVDRAGRMIARMTYGANRGDANTHLDRALELLPDSRTVLYECAIRLPLVKGREGREMERELLTRASELPLGDAFDRLVQERVLEALAALEGN